MDPIQRIVEHTAIVFEQRPEELLGRSRRQPVAEARQAAMWAVRQRYPSIALTSIGAAMGGRHYTTVMHALQAVTLRAADDPAYRERLDQLLSYLAPPAPTPAPLIPLPRRSRWWIRHVTDKPCPH